jgi:hypothetical protein
MIQKINLKGTEAVLSEQQRAKENFVLCDLPGFAEFAARLPSEKRAAHEVRKDWYGGMTYERSLEAVRSGDSAGVVASDKLPGEMESLVPVSQCWRTVDSVVGMCPNVPQYLSGSPYSMRLKRRCATATAPLSVFVELVASAGIDAATCLKRGAAILAMVRMLANLRPVELWCVIAIGQRNLRSSLCVRLDTAPLDLARAAHMLTHPSVFRALGYKSLESAKRIRGALRKDRILMCTYEAAGMIYSLDNGIPVSRKLAGELTGASNLQADLFLRPNEDGLFPGFTQTWRAER